MTRPSSSLLRQPLDKPLLVDSSGELVPLGELVGSGGEGCVFEIQGAPNLVAKVYHAAALPNLQDHKLRVLTTFATDELLAISAWPRALLFEASKKRVRGLMMPRIADAGALHELYGTTTRARHFPHAQWGHLVLAARNLAAAFATMHERKIVVGDVNQGNLMVDANMCVRFIDCDSFQVKHRNHVFRCPVGTPHFTPPELQSIKLSEVDRTPNHDAFGLAILIFHLLYVGRHPFAGRYLGEGDMTIERAIAERRFAFSKHTDQTQLEPPPASLTPEDLPSGVGELFERAFRAEDDGPDRPSPKEWVAELEKLLQNRKECPVESAHVHSSAALGCPWCRIENAGGPTFFLDVEMTDGSSESRLAALDTQLAKVKAIHFPEVPAGALKLPRLPLMKAPVETPKREAADWIAAGLVASVVLCLAGAFYWPLLAVGAVGSLATSSLLAFGEKGKARRSALAERDAKLAEWMHQLVAEARAVSANHAGRKAEYDAYATNVSTGVQRYQSDTEDLQTILRQLRIEQKEDFLRGYSIRDYRRRIPGLTQPMVSVLESFGIDSAFHVEKDLMTGVPYLTPALMMELTAWRERMEDRFEYKPEAGMSERELNADRQEASRRFKIALARKILHGAKRMRAMAFAAKNQLDKELRGFKSRVTEWRAQAKERQDDQALRSPWERKLNASIATLLGVGAGAPLVGLLLWWMFS